MSSTESVKPQRVTDFGIGEINMSPEQWMVLPPRIKEKLEVYNTNPDAFVRGPVVMGVACYHFVVANYRVEEIMKDLVALNA